MVVARNECSCFTGRRPALRISLGGLLGCLGWLAVGCARTTPRTDPPDAGVADIANTAAATTPPQAIVTLGDKIAFESSHRTATDTPKVEDVYAALEKAGFTLREKQQHVASVFGAQYCVGAKTDNDMALSVCEYTSPEAARSGREMSLRELASVPNREIYVNRKTSLTIRQPPNETSASQAATKTAADVFEKL